jgi:hypothetical protein
MKQEQRKARKYACERVSHPAHLVPLLAQARLVWAMGHVASNAVANAAPDFPKEQRRISQPPFPEQIAADSRYFVSEYFHRFNERETSAICEAFARFARGHGIKAR